MSEDNAGTQDICQPLVAEMLIGRAAPELILLYLELLQTLYEANFTNHVEEIDLLHASLNSHSIDTSEVTEAVDAIIRTAYDRCFSLLGISTTDDIPLDLLAELGDIVLLYDTTDTPEFILNAVDSAEDADEAFLKILEFKGVREIEEWMPYIASVNPGTVDRIRKLAVDEINNSARTDHTFDHDLGRRLSRLSKLRQNTVGATLVNQQSGIGASLESLYGLYVGKLFDQSLEQSVDDLYSMAVLSCESLGSAQAGVATWLDDLCTDADERRRAEQISLRLSREYAPIFGE